MSDRKVTQFLSAHKLRLASHHINTGGLIAYPTEAVYGLGCHPEDQQAVLRLLALKQRPIDKGLILVAANIQQLQPYVIFGDNNKLSEINLHWPGPVTWLLPARPSVPLYLRGNHKTIAVRITAHPIAAALSDKSGTALVSTSANKTGFVPARTALKVRQYFGNEPLIINGKTGGHSRTSAIFDAVSGKQLR